MVALPGWLRTVIEIMGTVVVIIAAVLVTSLITIKTSNTSWQVKMYETIKVKDKEIVDVQLEVARLEGEISGYTKVIDTFSKTGKRKSLGVFEVTAYDRSGCVPFDDGFTSIGMPIGEGIFAVNPKIIPYGSVLRIHGKDKTGKEICMYGIAGDTGGAMRQKPRLIDIFIPVNKDAREFGRQKLNVELISFNRRS